MLAFLARHAGQILPREAVLAAVWGYGDQIRTRTLDVHIAWLHQKLEDEPSHPRHIVTVRGLGYKFKS